MSKESVDKLKEATESARQYLKDNHNPMTEIRVTQHSAEVLVREEGTGYLDDEEEE